MRLLLPGLVIWMANFAIAQEPLPVTSPVPVQAIKVSPLHLLNFYPTIELSFEQKILPRFTLQAEVGYVLDYDSRDDESFQNKRGVKLKLEGRHYFGSRPHPDRIFYGAIEPYMNVINFDRSSVVEECFDLECDYRYIRRHNYEMAYRENGVSLKAGIIRYLGESPFFVDINSGLTLRNIHYGKPAVPQGSGQTDEWTLIPIPNEDDRIILSPNLGLRMGYRFK